MAIASSFPSGLRSPATPPGMGSPAASRRTTVPGVATGLAWTPFGGEILFVESALIQGKDEMILTGQMGDVMKESARLGLSIIKGWMAANLDDLKDAVRKHLQ